ncbi:MAG: septum site-determining protein MinD, partial [Nitrospinota bacterium]
PEQMAQLSDALKQEFDFVLFDSPAGIEQGFRNAVAGAMEAILVTTPEVSAIRDADRVIGLLQAAGIDPWLIINRLSATMIQQGDMLDKDDIIDILGIPLLGIIPEDEGILISSNRGLPIVLNIEYTAGKAFRRIARRLIGEDVPLPDLTDPQFTGRKEPGFLTRLGKFFSTSLLGKEA